MRRNIYIVFILIMSILLLTACVSSKSIRSEDLKTTHDLLIIPYKTAPIYVSSVNPAVGIAFPLFAVGAEYAAKGDKEKFIEFMDEIKGDWNPSAAIAKECSALIKNNRKVQINNIAIANVHELPGTEKLRVAEPRVFTSKDSIISWRLLGIRDWLPNDLPTIQYKQEYPQNQADWALEIFSSMMVIRDESIYFDIIIKIFNTDTGEKIAAIFYPGSGYNRSPIKDKSGFKKFEEEFGYAAKQTCGGALNKIGLINFKEN